MKPSLSRALAAALLATSFAAIAADIDVMTQNQYLGADLAPVLGAATAKPFDPDAFSAAVATALGKIAATRPAERVRALADEIADRRPDVVGVQEAYAFGCTPYPGVPQLPGKGCDDPSIKAAFTDHLQDTATALHGKYVLAGRVTNLSIAAIPFAVNGWPAVLSVVDRDAIFVRKGLRATAVDFGPTGTCTKPSDQGCNYLTAPPPFDTPLGPIAVERGFLAVDVTVDGSAYRVFNTHLEQRLLAPNLPETRLLQVGQAYELLGTALGTWDGVKRVIVVGDFNSAPVDTIPVPPYPATLPWAPSLAVIPPYRVFVGTGFTDAWSLRRHADPGLSCCQAEDLLNRKSELSERIDLIFSLTPPSRVVDAELIGDRIGDKTRPPGHGGLWPSDHAAVAARLKFDW
jgi:endonuclease/exonuclease/phosphatase family metal-dependent hydrolase